MKDLRILLVEDEPTDVLLMRDLIDEWNNGKVSIEAVDRIELAINRAGEEAFDIVMLDLGLPDSQGLDSFRRFHHERPKLPVLVMTGLDDSSLGILAMQAGAQDFIPKLNLDPQLVKRAVKHALERHRLKENLERGVAELAAREQQFKLAMIGASAVLWDWDAGTDKAYFGEGLAELLGITEAALPQDMPAFRDRIHPDDLELVVAGRELHLVENVPFDEEFRLLHGSGSYRWVQARGQAWRDETGVPYRMVGWIIDITERKQSEAALRNFRSYVDQSQDGFEVVDLQTGRFLDVNDRELQQLGYTREEMLKLHIWDIDSNATPENFEKLRLRLSNEGSDQGESSHRRKDGSTFPIEYSARLAGDAEQPRLVAAIRDITERLERNRKLRFQQEILEDTGKIAQVGGWLYDYDSQRAHWTNEIARIHEIDVAPEDEGRDYWLSFYDSSSRTRLGKALDDAASDGTPFDLELQLTTPKGNHKWIRSIGQPVSEAGRVVRLRGSFQDVTARHEEEDARLARERYFRSLIERSNDVIAVSDREGRVKYVSSGIERILGYSVTEYLALGKTEHMHPDDVSRFDLRHGELLREPRGARPLIWRRRHKQGHWVWLEGVSTNLLDDPAVDGLVSNFRDVSERVRANREIEQQARMLDAASDAIVVCDLQRTVRYWNAGAERLYGWSADETKGRDISIDIDDVDTDSITAQQTILQKGEWSGVLSHRTKDGRRILVQSRGTLLRDQNGQPELILTINTDVTEQKEMETRFLRAQRLESIGTLAGGIAHDFNNVLSPIMMALALLRRGTDDAKTLRLLDMLESSAERGKDLVAQVLGFSRGVVGKHMFIKPKHLVRELLHIMEMTFPKSITIEPDLRADVSGVMGDPTQIDQVLMNLCVNARDAMPTGGQLKITLRNQVVDKIYAGMRSEATPGNYVVIEVEDTGEGIATDVREHIFEPFFTTKVKGHGTGLGLATCLGILKSHRGFIECESEVGVGTKFQVFLPAHGEDQSDEIVTVNPDLTMGRGETVLVVEDDLSVRTIAEQTLSSFNYKVLLAPDGAQGVSTYVAHRAEIAAIITDLSMPVMEGDVMINAIRAIDPKVKILLSTGLDIKSAQVHATKLHPRYIISKPYVAEQLLSSLRVLLDQDIPDSDQSAPGPRGGEAP